MARRVFYSFHYEPDNWRASQVRNIGAVEGNQPAKDNDWETVKRGGDAGIQRWISDQMSERTCSVVLIGAQTAGRKWINYEIIKSWNDGLGVVGLRIHGLQDSGGNLSTAGSNPFFELSFGQNGKRMYEVVKMYTPVGTDSKPVYAWIRQYLSAMIEEAVTIRQSVKS